MTREEIINSIEEASTDSFTPGGLHLSENFFASIRRECTLGLDGLMWREI